LEILGFNINRVTARPVGKVAKRRSRMAALVSQFLFLLLFLLLGVGVARLGLSYGPSIIRLKVGGKLIEYRKLELVGGSIVKRENVKDFAEFSVLTKTMEPENAFAKLVVYGIRDNGSAVEIQRLDSVSSSWTSCDQQISYSAIEIRIDSQSQVNETPQPSPSPIESVNPKEGNLNSARGSGSPEPNSGKKSESPGSISQKQNGSTKSKENELAPIKIDLLIYLRPK
jgi:hypothetical protein